MRFMVMAMVTKESEGGPPPTPEAFAAMQKYNEELAKAGVLLAAEGLSASSQGVRVKFSGDERIVVDGPFAETKELIDGFALVKVSSKEEAIRLASEFMKIAGDGKGEILQMFDQGQVD